MATVNIGQGNAGDQFYRYKMPRLQAKVEPVFRVDLEFQSSPLHVIPDHGIQSLLIAGGGKRQRYQDVCGKQC